jgi:hypothetical protein
VQLSAQSALVRLAQALLGALLGQQPVQGRLDFVDPLSD